MKYLRRAWFWCLRYCYWSCLILLILAGTEFLPMVKGSWTKNDGAGSGSYYFILAFHSVEDLTEGMCVCMAHGIIFSAGTACGFCCCPKAAQILLWPSTAQLYKAVTNLMVGTNQTAGLLSCCLFDMGSCGKTLGFWLQHGEYFESCSHFSRCRFEVLEE